MKWYLVELLYSVKTNRLFRHTCVKAFSLFSVNSLLNSHTWVKGGFSKRWYCIAVLRARLNSAFWNAISPSEFQLKAKQLRIWIRWQHWQRNMLICGVIEILFYISWLRHELDQIMFCQVNNIPLEGKSCLWKCTFFLDWMYCLCSL